MGLGDKVVGDTSSEKSDKHPLCQSCNKAITSRTLLSTTVCDHTFHVDCLSRISKLRPFCPVCNTRVVSEGPTRNTRAQGKTTIPVLDHATTSVDVPGVIVAADDSSRGATAMEPIQQSNESLQSMISSIMAAQQSHLMSTLSVEIKNLVETSVRNSFSRLSATNSGILPPSDISTHHAIQSNPPAGTPSVRFQMLSTPPRQMRDIVAMGQGSFGEFPGVNANGSRPVSVQPGSALSSTAFHTPTTCDLRVRPDRVLQIMSNWRIKFNGGQNGLTVEHFIYRVEALTRQTLNGDYNLLCSNAGLLFEGKADYWFWRYHMSVPPITWPELCIALRKQYKDSRTDIVIRELIRDRKQKTNESFDSFYESIVLLTDRLVEPLHERSLVEILRRNLRPEIQHEILNLRADTVEELRDICRRREFFIQDMHRKHGVQLSKPLPRLVSEIFQDFEDEVLNQNVEVDEIDAMTLICWNCQKPGHRYPVCLAERMVFCYGCGKPDTYKPNCLKCSSKNAKASASTASRSVQRPSKQTQIE